MRHLPPAALLVVTLTAVLFAAPPLAAQTIRGQLVVEGAGTAIDAALVVLVDERGEQRAGSLTDAAGRFTVRAPAAGRYRLRAERIGFRTTMSPVLTLAADQIMDYRMAAAQTAVVLEGVEVQARRRCTVRPQDGVLVATLWDEARKALNAAAWTERQGLVRFRAVRFERDMEPRTRRVLREEARSWWGGETSPFVSRPAEQLIADGYVRADGDSLVFYAPDADVLLSREFENNYCFGVRGERDGLVGVSFEPVGRRNVPDVRGVLWLDRRTAELRELEYRYTRLPTGGGANQAGGNVEFQRLPNGAWIVRQWSILMPLLAQQTSRSGTADIQRLAVIGLREEGGEVVEIHGGGRVAVTERAAIEGVVYDSIAGAPLVGATVFLDGTSYSVTTDENGYFRLDDLPDGSYVAAFMHPRLDSLDLLPPRQEVKLERRSITDVDLAVPSRLGVLAARCPATMRSAATGIVVGTVVNTGTDAPLAGVDVVLAWDGGRLAVTTDGEGGYRFCNAPRGVRFTVQAQTPRGRQASGPPERIALNLDSETLVSQDLGIALVQTVAQTPQNTFGTTRGRAELRGRLLDAETGQPIQGARVTLREHGTQLTTDRNGRFRIADLAPQRYTVEVEHVAYGKQTEPVAIGGGGIVEMELRVAADAIELPGLTVTVRTAREEMRRRSGTRLNILTRTELAELERTAHHVGDLVRRFPGVRVRELLHMSGIRSGICIEGTRTAPVEMPPPECRPVLVMLDDAPMPDGMEFLVTFAVTELESVQYIPAITARARYGFQAENGVLLLYTRGNGPTARGN